jgi:hypothetical protein
MRDQKICIMEVSYYTIPHQWPGCFVLGEMGSADTVLYAARAMSGYYPAASSSVTISYFTLESMHLVTHVILQDLPRDTCRCRDGQFDLFGDTKLPRYSIERINNNARS